MIVCDSVSAPVSEHADSMISTLLESVPEDGAYLLLKDAQGTTWHGTPVQWPDPCLTQEEWQILTERLHDGEDMVVVAISDGTLVLTELKIPLADCFYAMVVLPKRSVDHVFQNFDLVQIVLGQLSLISHCLGGSTHLSSYL
ncbi:hypothetical protein ACFL6U_28120 [Planctomycetota bacterium]